MDISPSSRRAILVCAAILAVAVFAAFGASLWYGFLAWDDHLLIVDSALVRGFSPRIFFSYDPELYIPITLLTFQIEHLIVGLSPWAFHLTNLLLHVMNAVLVMVLIDAVMRANKENRANMNAMREAQTSLPYLPSLPFLPFLTALLFALHPLQTETVVWISARKELLAVAFGLGSVLTYLRWQETGRSALRWWSVALFALSLGSKPTAILLPLALPLLDRVRGERMTRANVSEKIPFAALSVVFGVIAIAGKGAALSLSPVSTLLLAARSTTFYLEKIFLPVGLSPLYAAPADLSLGSPAIVLSVMIVMGLLAALWFLRRRAPLAAAGLGLFFLALAPSYFSYDRTDEILLAADRYASLPLVGICLILASLLAPLIRRRFGAASILAALVGVAAVFVTLDRAQTRVWRDTETLFTHALALAPSSPVALNNVGFQFLAREDFAQAQIYFEKTLALKPDYPDALVNLAVVGARQGAYAQAEVLLKRALALDPRHVQARFNLAGIHLKRGEDAKAEELYRETIAIQPYHAPALWQLTKLELAAGKTAEARAHYRMLTEIDPSYAGRLPQPGN